MYLSQMFKMMFGLQWKEFNRGKAVGGKLVTKIFKWFWIIYFALMSFLMAIIVALPSNDKAVESLKGDDPFSLVNLSLIHI